MPGMMKTFTRPNPTRWGFSLAIGLAGPAVAGPVTSTLSLPGPDDTACIASARFGGVSAFGDSFEDTIEIRDHEGQALRTISKAEIEALVPWMDLDGNADGPCAMAWSDSGRRLYIAIYDANTATDGGASDAILLYDRFEDAFVRFARLELASDESDWPHLGMVHFSGNLYVSDDAGYIHRLTAARNNATSSVNASFRVSDLSPVRGLAVDPASESLFAASEVGVYAIDLDDPSFVSDLRALASGVRALAWSSHYGGPGDDGLYILRDTGLGMEITRGTSAQAQSFFLPTQYTVPAGVVHDLSATSTGGLLLAADEDAVSITDNTDTRLGYDQWVEDEFAQVMTYAKGLIAPDGEPSGWVIDADVVQGATRFHPATPDGAAWVVLLLITNDHLYGDSEAQDLVRTILQRYAGTGSGPSPARSADGFFEHWIDPNTGTTKPGWPAEYATYSTMKIVLAAIRARQFYPEDEQIREASEAIVCGVANWDNYFRANNDEVFLKSLGAGGPDTGVWNGAFTEALVFAEQANAFGGTESSQAWGRWINRNLWPTATYVLGRPITGATSGGYLPVFITAYSFLLQEPFREDNAWLAHTQNVLVSHAAWSDENGALYSTVFSAGTTKPEWGGYNADSLSNHPGDLSTFPALMALAPLGDPAPGAGAYHAYRNGARAQFATGASMLYRRSNIDPAYTPNTAGLPDVAMGALGLAELIEPGTIDSVLALPIPTTFCEEPCPADVNGDGNADPADFTAWLGCFSNPTGQPYCGRADVNNSGTIDPADFTAWLAAFNAGCD